MSSPGHRRNILDKWHKKVNIGLAWDKYNLFAYQHFEGDHVEYDALPTIKGGVLTIEGRTKNGIIFGHPRDLGLQVYYDPPPRTLTAGQLSRTYCYTRGVRVASLREPLSGGAYWPTNISTYTFRPCPDPYNVPDSASAPRSHDEALLFWEKAYNSSKITPSQTITVPWITAMEWRAVGDGFSVRADLEDVIAKHGDGVYTAIVWGKVDGEDVVVSEYSIFYGVRPPDIYSVSTHATP